MQALEPPEKAAKVIGHGLILITCISITNRFLPCAAISTILKANNSLFHLTVLKMILYGIPHHIKQIYDFKGINFTTMGSHINKAPASNGIP